VHKFRANTFLWCFGGASLGAPNFERRLADVRETRNVFRRQQLVRIALSDALSEVTGILIEVMALWLGDIGHNASRWRALEVTVASKTQFGPTSSISLKRNETLEVEPIRCSPPIGEAP
jgi:hypothetical protein